MKKLSHTDPSGRASMVDVGEKPVQQRKAIAEGYIKISPDTVKLIKANQIKKGDVLSISEFAGIQGGKKCSELIPLCHPLLITKMDVKAELLKDRVHVTAESHCTGQTGVEMEALTAVSVALLTVYDMCKAVDKSMEISAIKLLSKEKK
ncbi:MAG: cyclic pyranopterin monophosphate synthase MoaC [Bacteroidales bacterium]|nr:cyclic pyranopterin monophosphate synthase MoaC [Bacteroidales bacterium]MCB8999950.1 cyclic pyranopterin monophosphate synthase MoaC [Bacteroidales bacterium]MCB9012599.1 cyclic pyranopterin monophosphate synthase MoaC [Bacteroidales bacterium]